MAGPADEQVEASGRPLRLTEGAVFVFFQTIERTRLGPVIDDRNQNYDLAQLSSLVFCDVFEDRLPRLLLLVNEAGGFGGRHRIRIAAERSKFLLQFRVERNFAQVLA